MAQANAAFLLDQHLVSFFDANGSDCRAFVNWKLSADQVRTDLLLCICLTQPTKGSADSRVKLGDYHYYGRGTAVNYVAAAQEYHKAVEAKNPQVLHARIVSD